jgi:uncharacterized coiled-coil protein SlyX
MIGAIIILTILVVCLLIAFLSAALHIVKIQKELEDLNKVDVEQDMLLEQIALRVRDLAVTTRDMQDYLIEQQDIETGKVYVSSFGGPIGEA